MAARSSLFIAACVFGAIAWWLVQGSVKPGGRVDELNTRVTGSSEDLMGKERKARSDDLERAPQESAAELERATLRSELVEASRGASPRPHADSHHSKSESNSAFDTAALEASGFLRKDIDWFRERWEQAEIEKRSLADLEARGEEPAPGRGYSDIERELREDLRDDGYDAMLYASNQSNRVVLVGVRSGSVASRAGIRDGSVVWSYDGQRVFRPKELANLSTTGRRGEIVEIVIITSDGTEAFFVERNPLGAELVSAKAPPHPN